MNTGRAFLANQSAVTVVLDLFEQLKKEAKKKEKKTHIQINKWETN